MNLNIFTFFLLYILVIIVAEFLYKKGVSPQITRKFSHIGAGIISVFLPVFVGLQIAIAIGIIFAILLFYSKKKNIIPSVYSEKGDYGVVYFPIGLAVCALVFWNINILIFQWAILLFALSDGLAGFIGEKYGKKTYFITGKKTIEGSLIFFIVSLVVLIFFYIFNNINITVTSVYFIILSAFILTCIEGSLGKGRDNLILPICVGIIIFFII